MPDDRFLNDLADYVAYEADERHDMTEVSPAVIERLKALAAEPAGTVVEPAADEPAGDDAQPVAPAPGGESPAAVTAEIAACTLCDLHKTRTNTVPGQGHARPEVMFVGEAPGADEDRQGLAFVGRAGQLLTKMIEAMGYTRDEVFIGNILKCRPPDNRKPLPDEMDTCLPYLKRQIALLQPKVIVCLGGTAMEGLLGLTGITRRRGTWYRFEGIDVMPTFHPAYLLRNPSTKHDTWADLKAVLSHLGRTPPPVKKR